MKLIVGLGNPEERYANTRHNLGFDVVDELARKLGVQDHQVASSAYTSWFMDKRFKAEVLKTDELLLAKPQTYMNQSGLAVSALKNFFKVDPEDIIVIHDELDLLLGHLKVRIGGGAGGHHGIENIIGRLGTDTFIRVRLGIGNDKSFSGERKRISFNAEKYVLEPFLPNESSKVRSMIKKAIKAIEIILDKGVDKAQNQFN